MRALSGLSRARVGALVFLLLTLVYGSQIGDIHELPVDRFEAMNARSMPWLLFGAGIVGSLLLWVLGSAAEEPSEAACVTQPSKLFDEPANLLAAAGLLVWTGVFSVLIGAIGFPLAVAVFLVGGFLLLGERRPVLILALAFGTAAVLWLILQKGFGLYLSPGTLWLAVVDVASAKLPEGALIGV